MFDFEKLEVYAHIRQLVSRMLNYLYAQPDIDPKLREDLKSTMLKTMLHLAEGTGRMAQGEKLHHYTTARSSAFECVALLQVLMDTHQLEHSQYESFYKDLETASKMLLGMIRSIPGKDSFSG